MRNSTHSASSINSQRNKQFKGVSIIEYKKMQNKVAKLRLEKKLQE